MLPFFLDENDVLEENKKPFEKSPISPQSLIGLQFYEGMLIALDSLTQLGYRGKVHVYDTGKDVSQLNALLKKPEFKTMDLIIGPLYLSGFNVIANFAKEHKIPIIAPFVQQNSIINDNELVLKSLPSTTTQFEQLAKYISSYYSGQNVVMVHKGSMAEKPMASAFANKMKESGYNVKEIIYSSAGISGVNAALSHTKNNIIVVPSNDQVFITDLITKLNFSASDKNITLFGTDNWLNFENIELSYMHKLNTHLPLINFINYQDESVKHFVAKYREKYATDPTNFVFQGYDVGMFYLGLLDKHGKEFLKRGNLKQTGLQLNFNQSKIAEGSGYENKSIIIVKYEDFQLKKVN
ncbi:MAG: amino acid ABC transporter substrate-binding protein [Bacteroidetes bacterium]|nr:amino acid ABC transporter substrate-binding protein [Bacteroidota bacterium]